MYKDLLKNKNFTLLAIGGFISSIGDYLYTIAVTVYLYSITNSVLSVALMWLSRGVLRIPDLYLSGIIADYFNKKKVIVWVNLLSGVVALIFIFGNQHRLWLIYVLTFLLQALSDMEVSSENAILPEIVPKDQLAPANSAFSFLQSTSIFLSPAIGGILYKLYGANLLFIINSVSFIIATIMFIAIRYKFVKNKEVKEREGIIKLGIDGYKVLLNYANVKIIFVIASVYAVLGRFYEVYKVVIADKFLNIKPEGIIYFDYALAIGGLLVPIIIKALSKEDTVKIFILSTLAISFFYIIFGFSKSFLITFAIMVLLGFTQNIQGIYSSTIIQNNIPQNYLGRVFSFYKIVLTLFALLGIAIASPMYNCIGVSISILIVSVILIMMCIYQFKGVINGSGVK
ncbi:MFS transporter [Clostridium sp. 19966]|uniref:MFS transporter n=1 Tax=Clostridium sp. 19966 TaxID=2768166 RepID=UPI0028DD53EC|nr:MFS transporter [Clostridium sp. 19966]MDT8718721.1 MFS transporter [Clostridium sp. 19966]